MRKSGEFLLDFLIFFEFFFFACHLELLLLCLVEMADIAATEELLASHADMLAMYGDP